MNVLPGGEEPRKVVVTVARGVLALGRVPHPMLFPVLMSWGVVRAWIMFHALRVRRLYLPVEATAEVFH